MNRSNRVIGFVGFAVLTAIAALICQHTAVGEEPVSTIKVQTPEGGTFNDGLAGAGTALTTAGQRLVSVIRGEPSESVTGVSPTAFVTATDASFATVTDASSTTTTDASTESSACGGCCATNCFAGGSWIVEAEGVFLAPRQRQSFGTVEFVDLQGVVSETFSTLNDGSFTFSPRFTLGWQGECWGVQARYWRLQTGDLDPDFIVDHPFNGAVPGDGSAIENSFRAETVDIEVTRLLCVGENGAEVCLSAGFRYAHMDEAAGLLVTETNALGTYRGDVLTTHKFNGGGFTLGLRGIRPIGCGHFNLFFGGRASVLWDPSSSNFVATSADFFTTDGFAHSFNGGYSQGRGNLFIGELQGGLQWNVPLKCVPANAFVRVAAEYQYWSTGSDSGVAAFSGAGPLSGPFVIASGKSIGNSAVDLVGLSLGTGLTW